MQIIVNGLISGFSIALLALAFQIVYLPTRVFFIGLAGLYSITPYIYFSLQKAGMPWFISSIAALSFTVVLALLCEYINHAPLTRKGASEGAHLISSLGISILLVQIVAMVWGNEPQTLRTGIDSTIQLGGLVLTRSQLLMAGVSILMLLTFLIVLRTTEIGLRLRALADNASQFALYGYNINAYRLIAFGLAGLFVTFASLLNAIDLGFDPHGGLHAVLLAVVAVIIGGRGSFIGPIIGGIVLGLMRALIVWQFSARWQEAVTFAVLAIILLLRPQGLFGQKLRIEATC